MRTQLLIDSIVRQTTVLIAQLATAGGFRAPLAHLAEQVFRDLARALHEQGRGGAMKRGRLRSRSSSALFQSVVAALIAACGDPGGPQDGSESRFLRVCSDDAQCGDALQCIDHACTRVCTSDAQCTDLAQTSACLAAPLTSLPAASRRCGLVCTSDPSCTVLGEGLGGAGGALASDAGMTLDASAPSDAGGVVASDAPGIAAPQLYEGFEHRAPSLSVEVDLTNALFEGAVAEDGVFYSIEGSLTSTGITLVRYDRDFVELGRTDVPGASRAGGPSMKVVLDAEQHPVVVGTKLNRNTGGTDDNEVYLLRFTPDGTLLWERAWARASADAAWDLCATADGRIVVATESFPWEGVSSGGDVRLLEFDLEGTMLDEVVYGGAEWLDREPRIHVSSDGRRVAVWGESDGTAFTDAAYWAWRDAPDAEPTITPITNLSNAIGIHVTDAHDVFVAAQVINHYAPDGRLVETLDPAAGGSMVRLSHLPDGSFIVNGKARVDPASDAATFFAARYEPSGALRWRMSYDAVASPNPGPLIVAPDGTLYAWEYGTNTVLRFDPEP